MIQTASGPRETKSAEAQEIEVFCASDVHYLPHAATMLCSLLEHNSVSQIHLVYSDVPFSELAKLKSMVEAYKGKIEFYEVDPSDVGDLRVDKWASVAVYYRLLAPRLLPDNIIKILYLDCDLIVRRSLKSLWETNITGFALAAVSNFEDNARKALGLPDGTKYFNSGVLLINLQFWRENKVLDHAISFLKNNPEKVQYWDQDALNATLTHQWIELPVHWNWQDWLSSIRTAKNPAIVHFIAGDKPWHWSNSHPFKSEYRKYRLKTPWWRYREEGQPGVLRRTTVGLRSLVRATLPSGVRQWLRSLGSNFRPGA
jgi:lipopolysaccharide biosynthesis glycosyltransferase